MPPAIRVVLVPGEPFGAAQALRQSLTIETLGSAARVYAADVRRGRRPHSRQWLKLARLVHPLRDLEKRMKCLAVVLHRKTVMPPTTGCISGQKLRT